MDRTFSNVSGLKHFAINFFAFQKLDNERNTVVIEKEKEEYVNKLISKFTARIPIGASCIEIRTNNLAPLDYYERVQ
jgi:hypothetical protein